MTSEQRPMLCDAQQAVLLIIDVQERLTAAMPNGVKDRIDLSVCIFNHKYYCTI